MPEARAVSLLLLCAAAAVSRALPVPKQGVERSHDVTGGLLDILEDHHGTARPLFDILADPSPEPRLYPSPSPGGWASQPEADLFEHHDTAIAKAYGGCWSVWIERWIGL